MIFFDSFKINFFELHPPLSVRKDFHEQYAKKVNASRTVLRSGDGVFIPPWWYHSAKNLDFTIAVAKIYTRYDLFYAIKNFNVLLATGRSYYYLYLKYIKHFIYSS